MKAMSPADSTKPMSEAGFSASWLDLREPADHAARDDGLLRTAHACVKPGQFILDLGSGTGSSARAFLKLGARGKWRFLDGDPTLLDLAFKRHPGSEQIVANLADLDALPLDNVGLVTASALFDLMPRDWIEALAARLCENRISLYSALNFNGEMSWTPADPLDAGIAESFNRHQLTDKGMGNASGAQAAQITKEVFEAQSFRVVTAESPWNLGPESLALQTQLNEGIAIAAQDAGYPLAQDWLLSNRKSHTRIGHTDVLALVV